jgi:diguanylate cyclase (GGDEF)-like protein
MNALTAAANRQLLKTIWPFLTMVMLLVALAAMSLAIMSSVRAYIGGESTWSKGQKDAAFYLSLYAQTGNEKIYQDYKSAIRYPKNLQRARLALDRDDPHVAEAREALLDSGVYPADVDAVIWVFRTFRRVSYFSEAVSYWKTGDVLVEQLSATGDRLHADFASGERRKEDIDRLTVTIWEINGAISPISRAFSAVLSVAFRDTALLLLAINLIVAILLVALSAWHARRLITARLATENALRRSEARAKATLGSIGEAVISVDLAGRVEFINPAAERLLSCERIYCIDRPLETLVTLVCERDRRPVNLVGAALAQPQPDDPSSDLILTSMNGTQTVVQAVSSAVRDADDVPVGVVLLLRNMTREREYISNLAWQATHDGLTGLLNRVEFERRLGEALSASPRGEDDQRASALMILDLDQFKVVNDTFGHAAGDAMLRDLAQRICHDLPEGAVVGRLGGDEFGVLVNRCRIEEAEQIAERLRQDLGAFVWAWETHTLSTSVSIGIVDLRQSGLSIEMAMRYGDIACYMAKERGRDRVQLAVAGDNELTRHASEMSWCGRIKDALAHDRFCLYAQSVRAIGPSARDNDAAKRQRHVEILLRMTGESGEIIAPGAFMPAGERYGLMSAIDRWVVRAVFAQLADASRADDCEYAINLSGASIGDERFLEFLHEQFRQTGIAPESICFEVTETTAVANLGAAIRFIQELKRRGCKFALDDFGAGMSSFGYLKHLPVDYLKIDGSFIKDMLNDPVNLEMVGAINDIGHSMGRLTIAEYVESAEIVTALQTIGVDYVQGFHIGRPQPWTHTTELLSIS